MTSEVRTLLVFLQVVPQDSTEPSVLRSATVRTVPTVTTSLDSVCVELDSSDTAVTSVSVCYSSVFPSENFF